MALPDKHQLKFNSHKDAKTLMEAIEKRFGGNTETKKVQKTLLKQQFENFTGSSSERLDQIHDRLQKLVSQLSAAASVSAACAKLHVSSLHNVDSLSNAIDVDDLEEMDLRWQMAMLTMRARRFLQKTGRNLGANGPTSMGFYMSKVGYYNCHRKGHFARECRSPKDLRRPGAAEPQRRTVSVKTSTSNALVSQCDGLESVEARLLVYKQNESVFEENIKLLNIEVQLRDTALVTLRQKLEKAEQERDDLKLKLQPSGGYHVVPPLYTETFMPPKPNLVFTTAPTTVETDHLAFNVQLSPTKPEQDLSHTTRPISPIIKDWPIETSIPAATPAPASPKSTSSGKRKNSKACFVCKSVDHLIRDCDYHTKKMAQPTLRNYAPRGTHKQYASLTHTTPHKHMVLTTVLTQSKPVFNTVVRPVSAAMPKINVTQPRYAYLVITKSKSPIRRYITRRPSSKTSNSPPRVTAVKASVGNPQHTLKDKGVIDSGCSRHMTWNMSYLSDFKELHGGYVAFRGNPKGDNITGKGKIKTDPLGKFKGKVDEGFLVGYPVCSNAFRVFNSRTRINQETLHVNFLENKPNVAGSGPTWLFDIDSLTRTMNYQPVTTGNQTNSSAGFQDKFNAEKAREEVDQQYVLFPMWSSGSINPQNNDGDAAFDGKEHDFDAKKPEYEVVVSSSSSAQLRKQDDKTKKEAKGKSPVESFIGYRDLNVEFKDCSNNSSNEVNAAGSIVLTVGQNSLNNTNTFGAAGPSNTAVSPTYGKSSFIDAYQLLDDPDMPELEDITYFDDEDVVGAEADFNNLESSIPVSPVPTTKIHKDHPVSQIIGDLSLTTQTRSMTRVVKDQGGLSQMFDNDFDTCMFACFLSQEQPNREEGIDYEEVFAPVARIEAIRLFLTYASFMGFMVYQMDVKSAFLYETIKEEVYVCQPLDDIVFGATNKDLCKSFEKLMKDKFQMSSMGELTFFLGLQVKQKKDGIFISQDKYVAEILRKFRLTECKSASTPIDTEMPLMKDLDGEDVDVHTYRSMIGSLMYLTSSRPDIMFPVSACARFQVTPKASYLHAVKRIFRYLKGKPHLGLWYLKDSPFDLVAYLDSEYAGASLDRISTTGGCQFLRCRLIS
uniref:CCHC-type domain-containing protein n=1 Tax=Tanacetum cinerariifolium TaxID=118510 RepID=A0A6L2J7L0_TANCI|nr:hypothetical protein [Tanacetum cinerariifolium]